jgi:hypothetical protein
VKDSQSALPQAAAFGGTGKSAPTAERATFPQIAGADTIGCCELTGQREVSEVAMGAKHAWTMSMA